MLPPRKRTAWRARCSPGQRGTSPRKRTAPLFDAKLRILRHFAGGCASSSPAGVDGLPPANVIAFSLEGDNKLIVRPSGTEPKVKAYLFAKGATRAAAEELLASLEAAATAIME